MPRHFWKGSLSFGLVEIPVTLRPAEDEGGLAFTLLDQQNFAPVGNKRYNKRTGREVPWNRVVRGYEYEPEQYVVLTDEELRSANAEATGTIELVEFVEKDEVDPIYYSTPYYAEPAQKASRSYPMLLKSLKESGLVGIARVVLRTRQHVCALLPHGNVLLLVLLRYADELRKPEVGGAEADEARPRSAAKAKGAKAARNGTREGRGAPSPAEVRMASQLIQGMKGHWRPSEFKDEYRADVMALIKKKVRSGKVHEIVTESPEAAPRAKREVLDLMSVLKQSLEKRGVKAGGNRSRAGRRAEPKRRRA